MTQFDVVDVASLQKFVIDDFNERHLQNYYLFMNDAKSKNEEEKQIQYSKYLKINHQNMQSAQVN